jgi:hypothetical protein
VLVLDAKSVLCVESASTTSGSVTAALIDMDGVGADGAKDGGAGSANDVSEGLAVAVAAKARSRGATLSAASSWIWALFPMTLSALIDGTAV